MIAIQDLLATLYDDLDQERPWERFLTALAAWTNSTFATLIIASAQNDLPGTFVTPHADAERSAAYLNSFFADDPFTGLPDGKVTSLGSFFGRYPPDSFAAYRQYLALAGGEQVLGVDLKFPGPFDARFRVSRSADRPDFGPQDIAQLQSIVPHLKTAVRLYARLQFAHAEQNVFRSAAESMGVALLVLDTDGGLVSSNALADRFLRESEGISLIQGSIRLADSDQQRALRQALSRPAAGDLDWQFRIERPRNGDLLARARPINLPTIHSGTGAMALFLSHPGHAAAPSIEQLRSYFGLSPAEARLAIHVFQGSSLVEAARHLNITHNAAKAQLKAVFAKTGAQRQTQLVAMLKGLLS